jgi:hypothetical protein
MQVEQITYGSIKRQRMKGYQIIGKSPGIDSRLATAFCRWAPSHNSLETAPQEAVDDAWGLSFYPLSEIHFAIARSIHGGAEYSGRGGLAVCTTALVLTRRQLAGYAFHPIDLARTAITFGHLILQIDTDQNRPQLKLPQNPLSLPLPKSDFTDSTVPRLPEHAVNWTARESCSLLRDGRRVMVVGVCDPLPILTLLFDQLKPAERSEISFACGLKHSSQREFRLQFTREPMNPRLKNELERSGIAAIDLQRVLI